MPGAMPVKTTGSRYMMIYRPKSVYTKEILTIQRLYLMIPGFRTEMIGRRMNIRNLSFIPSTKMGLSWNEKPQPIREQPGIQRTGLLTPGNNVTPASGRY